MILTHDNYFSKKADERYLSSSQYHNFCSSLGRKGCEERALAILKGEYAEEPTVEMMVGSYVDAHFSSDLDIFKAKTPKVFTKKGQLRAKFKKANAIIERIESDAFFMKYMDGEIQTILTGEIGGVKCKCKLDVLHREHCIVDLKIVKSLTETSWVRDYGHVTFIEFWGIDHQAAIYQELVRQNIGKKLPFYIAGASKEPVIDIEIINIDDVTLKNALIEIESNVQRIVDLKSGKIEPEKCGVCMYCRETKILTKPIHFTELNKKI